jgi:hypothetical protein
MKLAIVGSAHLTELQTRQAAEIVGNIIRIHEPTTIISGGATGVDRIAQLSAIVSGISYRGFHPTIRQWKGPGGFEERNLEIAKACDHLVRIVIPNATTYGSGWTRDRAAELGKPTEEYVLDG